MHGLHLSRGEHRGPAAAGGDGSESVVSALQMQAQASPILPMDETGWREDGQHGYVWFTTTPGPEPVWLFLTGPEPGACGVRLWLRGLDKPAGHLVTDFLRSL